MRLVILGSAAAEGVPALFCACETCREARRRGGRDLRRRTAYLWDHVLVDCGPDLLAQSQALGLDLSELRHLLLTHTHADHLLLSNLEYRRVGYSLVPPEARLTVYGNAAAEAALDSLEYSRSALALEFVRARVGEELDLGEGRSALPLRASHNPAEECLLYLLRAPEGTALLANDSGWWPEDTWAQLAAEKLDLVLIDCTYGLTGNSGGHLNAADVIRAGAELHRLGCLAPAARIVANHFSHNGRCLQADLEARLGPAGLEVGYDGMVLEV
ncbi:MAG TPA: MBL fold metallo-hydrolase [Armatimonadota bacterium]